MSKSKAWTWTWHDPDGLPDFRPRSMTYMVYALQMCPKTFGYHYQGYTQFRIPKDLRGFQSAHPEGAHGEISRGTPKENWDYIVLDKKKTNLEDAVEHGEVNWDLPVVPNQQGARNDLKAAMKDVKEGKSIFKMREEHPMTMARYERFINQYRNSIDLAERGELQYPIKLPWFTIEKPDPAVKKRHWYVCGPPNVGKTKAIREAIGDKRVFWISNLEHCFEDYDNEDIIIMDDVACPSDLCINITDTHCAGVKPLIKSRYLTQYWKKNHCRVLIVIANRWVPLEPREMERYNLIYVPAPAGGGGNPPPLHPPPPQEEKRQPQGGFPLANPKPPSAVTTDARMANPKPPSAVATGALWDRLDYLEHNQP